MLKSLNSEQLLPVKTTQGAVLVTAGAGSGKTRLLTHRIAYLVQEQNVSPHNILAITFTNKAANEMKTRIEAMLGNSSCFWISTFHSLCVKILRKDINLLGYTKSFSIYGDDEKNRIFKDIFSSMDITDEKVKRTILFHISRAKNNNFSPEDYEAEVKDDFLGAEIIQAYKSYEQKLKKSNALDFDDLLIKTFLLLSQNPEVLAYYQNLFHYIHVDEFQDTNKVQYDLLKLLAGERKNILVVGDEDQCIYGWRGANIENIQNFQKDFKPKVFKLEQNFRSTQNILKIANKVIANNSARIKKTLWTENEAGDKINYVTLQSDKDEADFVVSTISNLIRHKGYSKSDFAILMRLNALSRNFEFALSNAGISYKVLGGFKFFERSEIKSVIAYLKVLCNPFDEESLIRIINFPKRGIGETTIEKLRSHAKDLTLFDVILNIESFEDISSGTKSKIIEFRNLFETLKQNLDLPLSKFVKFMVKVVDFEKAFDRDDEEELSKILNIEQFVQSVEEFEKDNPQTTLDEFLQSVSLLTDLDATNFDESFVLVSTIHAVKGLEFKVVFVVGNEEGVFPIIRKDNSEDEIEEERRLAYVAITRAKEKLFLTNTKTRFLYNNQQHQKPSRFMVEAGFEKRLEKNAFEKEQKPATKTSNEKLLALQKIMLKSQSQDFAEYKKGTQVFHPKYGVGVITNDEKLASKKQVVVTFNVLGAKTLSLEYAPLKIVKK